MMVNLVSSNQRITVDSDLINDLILTPDPYPCTDVRIITLEDKILRDVYDVALSDAQTKYPNWPYVPNKRADRFLSKRQRDILKTKGITYVSPSVRLREDGTFEVAIDSSVDYHDQLDIAVDMLSNYNFDGPTQQYVGRGKLIPVHNLNVLPCEDVSDC